MSNDDADDVISRWRDESMPSCIRPNPKTSRRLPLHFIK